MCRNLGGMWTWGEGRGKVVVTSPKDAHPVRRRLVWKCLECLLRLPLVGLTVPLTDPVIQKDHFFASKRHK